MTDPVKTTCPYCGTGCGVVMSQGNDGAWAVGGDPDHPANFGKLCSKGMALADTLDDSERLLYPKVDGCRVPWSVAIGSVAGRLQSIMETDGPEAIAFYVSGQLLTEDYYVANKLLKGFIGSSHIDTNSRLCMASAVAGHKRAFGADVVPGCYDDLDTAELIVLAGSNLAWCHPVLHRRVQAARQRGARVVVIDPRRTDSCDDADLHLAIKPGTDVTLFNGLLRHLQMTDAIDRDWTGAHVAGLEETVAAALADVPDLHGAARICGVAESDLHAFYKMFAETPRVVTMFSQGVNQSAQGTDKVNAIINVHLATGRIGRPGMGPFSVTGQPNAMGGREVGGLSNQLAAHMDPEDADDIDRLRRFWQAPNLKGGQGLKAVDMVDAIEAGRIKAVWIMATNPAVSLPEADRVRRALAQCPVVIVSDMTENTDTARLADILLPAAAWGEKDGTVTNSERRISRQRPFRAPPGEARPDWWIMTQVARTLGFGKGFAYRSPAAIFREHAALSGFENDGRRAFDISGLEDMSPAEYDILTPFQWPRPKARPQPGPRLYGEGGFHTPDGRGRMVPVRRMRLREQPQIDYPLIANTGRYRDQWHTMTRTGLAARLARHRSEPLLDIHPKDAAAAGIADGYLVRAKSRQGAILMRARVTEDQRPGDVFLPIHWTDSYAANAVASRLVTGHVDPVSGQPESKNIPVRVRPFKAGWSALLLTRSAPDLTDVTYWCRHTLGDCWAYELAAEGALPPASLTLTPVPGRTLDRVEYRDCRNRDLRVAWFSGSRLHAVLFVAPEQPQIAHDWLRSLFEQQDVSDADRTRILAGRPPSGAAVSDPLICACFSVGLQAIRQAIADGTATTTEDIGKILSAGTGCGTCVPELKKILAAHPNADTEAA